MNPQRNGKHGSRLTGQEAALGSPFAAAWREKQPPLKAPEVGSLQVAHCGAWMRKREAGNLLLRPDTLLLNQMTEEGKGAVKAFPGCDGSCKDYSVKYFTATVPQPLISMVGVPHRRHYRTQFLFRSEMAPLKPTKWEEKQSALKLSQFAFQTTSLSASQPFRF